MQCKAIAKRTGKQCQAPAIKGKDKCRVHGGMTPVKHGLYSKYPEAVAGEHIRAAEETELKETLRQTAGLLAAILSRWTEQGVFFVTRQKGNAVYRVVEEREAPQNSNVVKDQVIEFTGYQAKKDCLHRLRRVEVRDEENDRTIVILTNHLKFGATTVSAIYKDRWQIEIFFKAIKQNLKIKTFVGTSKNALLVQIWTALIAVLLLKYLKLKSSLNWSLSNLIAMLRYNLFTYRDLWLWLNDPFGTPAIVPQEEQLMLSFR